MQIVVNEEAASVPSAAEPDAINNDSLDYETENAIGGLRIELSVQDNSNTRDHFSGTAFLGSVVNFPTQDIIKAWNNQDKNDYQQNILNDFVYEVCEDIATMELAQEESAYDHNRGLETISANADAK